RSARGRRRSKGMRAHALPPSTQKAPLNAPIPTALVSLAYTSPSIDGNRPAMALAQAPQNTTSEPLRRTQSAPQRSQYFNSNCTNSLHISINPPCFGNKKPCPRRLPVTGFVSLTNDLLRYLVNQALRR